MDRFHRLAALGLALLLALTACGGGEPAPAGDAPPPVLDIAQAVVESQPNREDYANQLSFQEQEFPLYMEYYGVDPDAVADGVVLYAGGVNACEVAVLTLAEGAEAADVEESLRSYLTSRLGAFTGYAPEQAEIVEAAEVVSSENGDVTALLICRDPDSAADAFARAMRGEGPAEPVSGEAENPPPEDEPPTGPAPEGEPAPQPEPEPQPDPDPDPQPDPQPNTEADPQPEPEPEPEPELQPEPDPQPEPDSGREGWVAFQPPGNHDMTIYDTSGILEAHRSGDASGLSEEDRATLEAAQAVLAACVTEGMTDGEKELALHDWVIQNLEYAWGSFGQEAGPTASTPYGGLVEGEGICLGYASTFQLLMDMAGVECMTVVGASFGSQEDHAWNLVRLDGAWYGVDTTWDDPSDTLPPEDIPASRRAHLYFNVTSDYLRATDHQWDYDRIPEAEGVEYAWTQPKAEEIQP